SVWNLALILASRRQWPESEQLWVETIALQRKLLGPDHLQMATLLEHLAAVRLEQNKFNEAEAPARECLATRESQMPRHWRTFEARSLLGASLLGQGKHADAEPLLRAAFDGLKERQDKIPEPSQVSLKKAAQRLVQLYEQTNRPDQAAEW